MDDDGEDFAAIGDNAEGTLNTTDNVLPPSLTDNDNDQENGEADSRAGMFLCWGCGEFGQHCHEAKEDLASDRGAVQLFCGSGDDDRVKLMACGSSHTLAVTDTNELFAWGNGSSGQLGTGVKESTHTPQKLCLYSNQTRPAPVQGVACGGRHSYVWLENGQMFSFGNNFYAQLSYDFRIKNFKENQLKPHLIQMLAHRPVVHVACGQKHSMFLFKDGAVAGVGSNTHGQLGTGDVKEAIVPKFNEDLKSVRLLTCGANHTVVVQEDGSLFMWGFSRACGSRKADVLTPVSKPTRHKNIVAIAAGGTHSVYLTANGNLYSWGAGVDGQLGHGDSIRFLSQPKRLRHASLRGRVAAVDCAESFTAAVTDDGSLYLFGRNCHTIKKDAPPSAKIFEVTKMDMGGYPVCHLACGAWHMCCVSGLPVWSKESSASDADTEDEEETSTLRKRPNSDYYISDEGDWASEFSSDTDDVILPPLGKITTASRDKTSVSIADFYAPTPDGRMTGLDLIQENQEATPLPVAVSPKRKPAGGGGWKRSYVSQKSVSPDSVPSPSPSTSSKNSGVPLVSDKVEEVLAKDEVEEPSTTKRSADTEVLPSNQDHLKEENNFKSSADNINSKPKGVFLNESSDTPSKSKKEFVLRNDGSLDMQRSAEFNQGTLLDSRTVPARTTGMLIHGLTPKTIQRSKTLPPNAPMKPLQYSTKSFNSYERQGTIPLMNSRTIHISENNMTVLTPEEIDPHKPLNVAARLELRQQKTEKSRERYQRALLEESRGRGKMMRQRRGDAAEARGVGRIPPPVSRTSSESNIYDMKEEFQHISLSSKPPLPSKPLPQPKAPSFVGGAARKVIKKKPVNYGHRSFTRPEPPARNSGYAITVENPRQKPIFSSGNSWKNDKDILLLGTKKLEQKSPNLSEDRLNSSGSNSAPAALSRSKLKGIGHKLKTSSDESSHDEGEEKSSRRLSKKLGLDKRGLTDIYLGPSGAITSISGGQIRAGSHEPDRNAGLNIQSFPTHVTGSMSSG